VSSIENTLQVLLSAVTSNSATRENSYLFSCFRLLSYKAVTFVLYESDASRFLVRLNDYLDDDNDNIIQEVLGRSNRLLAFDTAPTA
jgi:hypothetical protein